MTSTRPVDTTTHAVAEKNIVIPIIEEKLTVGKRITESGGTRIVKNVVSETVTVNEPTITESAEVTRVPVGTVFAEGDTLPTARQNGDTLIVPLFTEEYVVVKRTRLVEELHVRLSRTETPNEQTVTIRREEVSLEPIPAANPVLHNGQG